MNFLEEHTHFSHVKFDSILLEGEVAEGFALAAFILILANNVRYIN